MRFSDNGYYLEAYEKCENCGVLMYQRGIETTIDGHPRRFCSDWCVNWFVTRQPADGATTRTGSA
ncbi:MAG: hypothetical protein NTW00_17550 [Hyphomicrobiales bacterium]|jgi:hypothetical protein|nr:hypothetical protein [Hyphomicrobiales bacterium]